MNLFGMDFDQWAICLARFPVEDEMDFKKALDSKAKYMIAYRHLPDPEFEFEGTTFRRDYEAAEQLFALPI